MSPLPTDRFIFCEQGTPEWHAARCGRVTGSRVADIMRKAKSGGESKMRQTYLGELVAERLSNFQASDGFESAPMKWGKECEALARESYAFSRDVEVQQVGFVIHPRLHWAGSSPDGLVGDDGMIEIKCPNTATHINTLLTGQIDPDYVKQMPWNMACTGRKWCDFISFDPRLPGELQMFVRRFTRDEIAIAEMTKAVSVFLDEVEEMVAQLRRKFELAA